MRALLIVVDGAGVGAAPDAGKYNDEGANTLGHIFAHRKDFELPALFSLGLEEILSGNVTQALTKKPAACYGRMRARSAGKDSTAGLWEIAGVISEKPFAVFDRFPETLVREIEAAAEVEFLGNYAQNGVAILDELGVEHLKTGKPILYTSADSVMQIAAHEKIISCARLYEICRVARQHCNPYRIARVIARPFIGKPGKFVRTASRHDYPVVPPRTILNAIAETGLRVNGIGKTGTIFARSGVTRQHVTRSNEEGLRTIERVWREGRDGLIFATLADLDAVYGPQRDLRGFANALMEFDGWLHGFLEEIEPEDLVIITAGHGNDPTLRASGHTREEVPLLVIHDGKAEPLGTRESFADTAATLASFFHLKESWRSGEPFLKFARRRQKRGREV